MRNRLVRASPLQNWKELARIDDAIERAGESIGRVKVAQKFSIIQMLLFMFPLSWQGETVLRPVSRKIEIEGVNVGAAAVNRDDD